MLEETRVGVVDGAVCAREDGVTEVTLYGDADTSVS